MSGRHYWDGLDREDEELKRDIISGNKYLLLLQNIRDQNACWVIRSLLDKDISHRMKLDRFMVITCLTSRLFVYLNLIA